LGQLLQLQPQGLGDLLFVGVFVVANRPWQVSDSLEKRCRFFVEARFQQGFPGTKKVASLSKKPRPFLGFFRIDHHRTLSVGLKGHFLLDALNGLSVAGNLEAFQSLVQHPASLVAGSGRGRIAGPIP
jgi:hypothetical protein